MRHVVLIEPLIPQNTGNIGRLCAANELPLHLVEPLGFELSDKYMKRAGLDYWKYVDLHVHSNWDAFLNATSAQREELYLFSTKAEKCLFSTQLHSNSYLIFGNESSGLEQSFHDDYADRRIKIPIKQEGVRSLNLANSVAIAVYESLRQNEFG